MRWPDILAAKSIRGKLFIALTLLVFSIALAIYLYFPGRLKASALDASLEKITNLAEMIAYSVSPALDFEDNVEIEEVFRNSRQNKDLRYIVVTDNAGNVRRSFNPLTKIDPRALGWEKNPQVAEDGKMVHVMQPVDVDGRSIGRLYLGFSLEELQVRIAKTQRTTALVSLLVLIAGLVIVFAISLLLTNPLQHLTQTVEQISEGDLTKRSQIASRDEVGQLSATFNAMVDKLQTAQTELESLNLGLENRVLERTKDLQREIQERKLIEQELLIEKDRAEAANRAKSEFLASMSHELRTPLNAIIGFSQVLNDRLFGELNDRQAEYIKDIETAGEHLLGLINDILDIAKIEAGKMELESSSVEARDFLEHCFVMVKEKCVKRQVGLELDVADGLNGLRVSADVRKLKQVMYNLLSNASKFTPAGGRISVRAKRDDEKVVISVADTGIGLEPDNLEKIFEEFFQVTGGIKDKTPGTGLGLSLARKLVELHGGRIWAESEGLGKGSRFNFEIPIGKPS